MRKIDALIRIGLLVLPNAAAFGHARLVTETPAAGATVTRSPTVLTLTFNENVQLAVLKLTDDGSGKAIPVRIDAAAPPARAVSVTVPPLAPGTYNVSWSALTTDDGHVVKGSYRFVVQSP